MQRAIVVCTWSGGRDYTNLCLQKLPTNYPVVVVVNDAANVSQEWVDVLQETYHVLLIAENSFELGSIEAVYRHTPIEEFWLIQHTIEVLNPEFIDIGFSYKGRSISYGYNEFENYLGKYIRTTLDKTSIPKVVDKWSALFYESEFHIGYSKAEDNLILCIDPTFYSDNPDNYLGNIFGEYRFVEVGKYLLKRRSISRESFNIPANWSDLDYQHFLQYWLKE